MTIRTVLSRDEVRVIAYDDVAFGDVEEVLVYEGREAIVFVSSPHVALASPPRSMTGEPASTPPSYDIKAFDGRTWHLPVKFEFCGPLPPTPQRHDAIESSPSNSTP